MKYRHTTPPKKAVNHKVNPDGFWKDNFLEMQKRFENDPKDPVIIKAIQKDLTKNFFNYLSNPTINCSSLITMMPPSEVAKHFYDFSRVRNFRINKKYLIFHLSGADKPRHWDLMLKCGVSRSSLMKDYICHYAGNALFCIKFLLEKQMPAKDVYECTRNLIEKESSEETIYNIFKILLDHGLSREFVQSEAKYYIHLPWASRNRAKWDQIIDYDAYRNEHLNRNPKYCYGLMPREA